MSKELLFVTAECAPFVKTGGLGDVAGALPAALVGQGITPYVVLPKYSAIPQRFKDGMEHVCDFTVRLGWRRQYAGVEKLVYNGVTHYFVDNEFYFRQPGVYGDGAWEIERYAFFCKAVVEMMEHLPHDFSCVHLNDWHTAMIAPLLRAKGSKVRVVFTIHNMMYQGITSIEWMQDLLTLPWHYYNSDALEFYGGANCMKGGLVYADCINTVSPTYAREILTPMGGEGLDGVLRSREKDLYGVLNGIDVDVFDPARDGLLAQTYSLEDRVGKAACKAALQEELGLAADPDSFLIGIVSRLTDQKGMDMIAQVADGFVSAHPEVQLAVLGSGDPRYEDFFRGCEGRWPGRVCGWIGYNEGLAHRVYAGCDAFLMPSRFEPCGLSQLIAMRYGTVPIVRETGGLKDTVVPFVEGGRKSTGFTFGPCQASALYEAMENALEVYRKPEQWQRLTDRGMSRDFGWDRAAAAYAKLYERKTV